MERELQNADIVDLGAASVETKGPFGPVVEPGVIGRPIGITDE